MRVVGSGHEHRPLPLPTVAGQIGEREQADEVRLGCGGTVKLSGVLHAASSPSL